STPLSVASRSPSRPRRRNDFVPGGWQRGGGPGSSGAGGAEPSSRRPAPSLVSTARSSSETFASRLHASARSSGHNTAHTGPTARRRTRRRAPFVTAPGYHRADALRRRLRGAYPDTGQTSSELAATRTSPRPRRPMPERELTRPYTPPAVLKILYRRFFDHIQVDEGWADQVRRLSERGTVLYVLRNLNWLDFLALDY